MAARLIYQLQMRRALRRERVFRDRTNPFDLYDDVDMLERFRFRRRDLQQLCDLLEDDLRYPLPREGSLPPMLQLLIALRFFATGSFQQVIGDLFGVSRRTAGRVIKRVCEVFYVRLQEFVRMPQTVVEAATVKEKFFNIAGFPHVIGCVDGTHVAIQGPVVNEHEYVNRKGDYSINVQLLCNADLVIMDCVVRWPGSVHDARIMRNSNLFRWMETVPRDAPLQDAYILGDSGYMLRDWLMTPYLNPQGRAQEDYNAAHISTRNTIERANGVLKRRWPCLRSDISYQPEAVVNIIVSCIALHNIARTLSIPDPDTDYEESSDEDDDNDEEARAARRPTLTGRMAREQLVAQHFPRR